MSISVLYRNAAGEEKEVGSKLLRHAVISGQLIRCLSLSLCWDGAARKTVDTTACTKPHEKMCIIIGLCDSSTARYLYNSKTTLLSVPLLSQKWPFVRLLGVQEPASVLFSLLNGAAVVVGYLRFSTSSPSDYHLHSVLHVQLLVSTSLPSLTPLVI